MAAVCVESPAPGRCLVSRKSPELRRLLAYEARVFNPAQAWLREVDLGEFAEMGVELDMMLVALHCVLRLEASDA